jgi:protein-S-isoprenylcysteine O-methyltransferase Ste14
VNVIRDPAARYERTPRRTPDDTGGVWILTGIVLGLLVYAGMVLMLVAGFSGVGPLVVIPPVLLALIAANSLLGGGRTHGRSPAATDAPPSEDAVTEGPSGTR